MHSRGHRRRRWGTAALFLAWLATIVVLSLGLVSLVLSSFFQFAGAGCPVAATSYPCTAQGMAVLTGVARYLGPAAALAAVAATWLGADDRPRVRWLLVGAIAVVVLYLVPAGIARSAYEY